MRILLAAALVATVTACAREDNPSEATDTAATPLSTSDVASQATKEAAGDGEQSDPQAIVVSWRLAPGLTELRRRESVAVDLRNTTDHDLRANVVLEITGLGVTRLHQVGTISVLEKGTTSFSWDPSSASVRPIATSAQVRVYATYTNGDVTVRGTTQAISYALTAAGDKVLVSPNDDLAVRLASMGRAHEPGAPTRDDERVALLEQLGSHRGWLDGVRVDRSPAEAADTLEASGPDDTRAVNDTIALPGSAISAHQQAVEEATDKPVLGVPAPDQPMVEPVIMCGVLSPNPVPAKTGKVCMYYRPDFMDTGVSSPVVAEDFQPYDSNASYANARVYASGASTNIGPVDSMRAAALRSSHTAPPRSAPSCS